MTGYCKPAAKTQRREDAKKSLGDKGSADHAADAAFDQAYVEVDQETEMLAAQQQLRKDLRKKNRS
jgi:hypothetical protein